MDVPGRMPLKCRNFSRPGYNTRMHEKPCRRWFSFRLRTLFVVVAVLSIPLAWAGYLLNWIRERRKFLCMKNEPFDMVDNVPPELESFMVTFFYPDPNKYERPRVCREGDGYLERKDIPRSNSSTLRQS